MRELNTSNLGPIKVEPSIGRHLASLNLFREPDGALEITVAGADGAMAEFADGKLVKEPCIRGIDYIETLIVEAAANMAKRIGK